MMLPAVLLFLSVFLPSSDGGPDVASAAVQIRAASASADSLEGDAYRVYNALGESVSLSQALAVAGDAEVVFFGEEHNDETGHYLELALYRHALATNAARPTALSVEMLARDQQFIVDEYLADLITESSFLKSVRQWANYKNDYHPMIAAAKDAGASVIASNAPRRYVNRVSRSGRVGLDAVAERAVDFLAPLPFGEPSVEYRQEWNDLMKSMMSEADTDTVAAAAHMSIDDAALDRMLQAQVLWDATMAYSIAEHLTREPGSSVVHIVGSFHVKNGTGIPEHLERYRPGTRAIAFVAEPVDDIDSFPEDLVGAADFVVLTRKQQSE